MLGFRCFPVPLTLVVDSHAEYRAVSTAIFGLDWGTVLRGTTQDPMNVIGKGRFNSEGTARAQGRDCGSLSPATDPGPAQS